MNAMTFTIHGEPVSKARARFTGRGSRVRTYTPAKTLEGEKAVAAAFREAGGLYEPDPEVTFAVKATFYNGTRQRRDVDNMLKLILDGLNKVAWVDDTQVMEVMGRKKFTAKEEARTEVTIEPIGRMDRLRATCKGCGGEFVTYGSLVDRVQFCTAECRTETRRKAREHTCQRCEKTFSARGSQRFCSRECLTGAGSVLIPCAICGTEFYQYKSWVTQRPCCSAVCSDERNRRKRKERATTHFPGTCLICGAGTTRKEYRRCNPCKLAGHPVPKDQS